jgi:hypothetical protein
MSFGWHFESSHRGPVWTRALLTSVALIALLAARGTPPSFANLLKTFHDQARTLTHHDQRPRFDRDGQDWSEVPNNVQHIPLVVAMERASATSREFFTLLDKGVPYKRPPPRQL